MLSARFRTLLRFLHGALFSLVERGQETANAAVAAIEAAVADRQVRLTRLMDRFEAGLLRARASGPRTVGPRTVVLRRAVRAAPLWPAHRAGWLNMIGGNHPSYAVRYRWNTPGSTQPQARFQVLGFVASLRTLVAEDAAMRGLLEASGEARRLVRWFLRAADPDKLPAILAEPPRVRTPRVSRPRVKRVPAPFEAPPENLMRAEREARLMWVPPAIQLYDPGAFPITPDWVQRRR